MSQKIVVHVIEKLKEGADLAHAKAAWQMVAEASAKVPGMRRFQSAWNEGLQRACITEVFDTPEDYLAFFSHIKLEPIQAALEFLEVRICCTRAQVPAFGDLIKNFGFTVFVTDDMPGDNKLAPTSNDKIIVTALEALKEGANLSHGKALWQHVSEASAKVRGMKRFQSAWNEEHQLALITEVFDTPEDYLAFFGNIDTSKMGCVEFKGITITCARAQVPAFGDLLQNFGFQVYLTDDCPGDEKMY